MGMSVSPKSGKHPLEGEESKADGKKPVKLQTKLNEEERLWVIGLQEELRKSPDLDGVSEWDIACHAIVAKNQPLKAIHRLRRIKQFQQAYKVPQHPTVYEAIKTMHDFCHAHPDFIQAIGKDVSGRWVLSFQLKGLTTTDQPQGTMSLEKEFAALYFLFMSLQPDLDSVRTGTIWIGDLVDVSRQTLSLSIVNGARSLCRDAFPIKVADVPCLNAPPKLSAVYAFCRPFFSTHLYEKIVWDCTPQLLKKHFSKQVLSKAFGGTCTQSKNAILDVLEENLVRRFENQETFRLNIY